MEVHNTNSITGTAKRTGTDNERHNSAPPRLLIDNGDEKIMITLDCLAAFVEADTLIKSRELQGQKPAVSVKEAKADGKGEEFAGKVFMERFTKTKKNGKNMVKISSYDENGKLLKEEILSPENITG